MPKAFMTNFVDVMEDLKKKVIPKKKIKILVPIGCRSDEGLSAPIIRRLKKTKWCECYTEKVGEPGKFFETCDQFEYVFERIKDIDLVLIIGDRIEMCAIASIAFHNRVKIAHVYAGILNTPINTLDDINRHCISLWADICFCEDEKAVITIADLWSSVKKGNIPYFYKEDDLKNKDIHNVGITHLDDLEIDDSLVPDEAYDLILYNPITYNINDNIKPEGPLIYDNNDKVIMIGPNPDKGFMDICYSGGNITHYDNLPRSQFFGLLSNCNRFITNSSSAYYEAPHFLKPEQIILVGRRNKNRSTPKKLEGGASDKIVRILEEYFNE